MNQELLLLPTPFRQRLESQMGTEAAMQLCHALDNTTDATVSVRINPLKSIVQGSDWQAVPWCEGGFILPQRPDFTADPLLHAGCYYVQEAASMAISLAYEAMEKKPLVLLDLCAAPGGKSTLWRSLMDEGALLVANEPVGSRAMILRENLQKWGHPDVMVTEALPKHFGQLHGLFDVIATDVPCSGEGMFRKDMQARNEWSEENAEMCAKRQCEIVSDVWPALREGGYLVYSTCTFNPAENEENVRWICKNLDAEIVPISTPSDWGIDNYDGMLRFLPHRTKGEGFFLALLQKQKRESSIKLRKVLRTSTLPNNWLEKEYDFCAISQADKDLYALRRTLLPCVTAVQAAAHTISFGVHIAQAKGRKLVPAHALALSTKLTQHAYPYVELSLADALQYLSRQSLSLPTDVERGYVIATYKGHPLGFLNNLGSRANNLYPSEWRIRRPITSFKI